MQFSSISPLALFLSISLACDPVDKSGSTLEYDSAESMSDPDDLDGDGFSSSVDCDDDNGSIHPEAVEVCDGFDNDCDGEVDEGLRYVVFADVDADGFGDADASLDVCDSVEGYINVAGDCDDTDGSIHPGMTESCDGIDNNCNDSIDEGVMTSWYPDVDADGYGDDSLMEQGCEIPVGATQVGGDCDDSAPGAWPGAEEVCDEIDNDCDGTIDEGVRLVWYKDYDADGYGDNLFTTEACTLPIGYSAEPGDCDDTDGLVYPMADEICDGFDNDCDAVTDESDAIDASDWYRDWDGDGYGVFAFVQQSCDQPSGYTSATPVFDCDDEDASIHPAADEYCDEIDNDCDGTTDESDAVDALEWYPDADFDNYGEPDYSVFSCRHPTGYVGNDEDCNDGDATVSPGATEVCNEIDDDCDGLIDDDDSDLSDPSVWYADLDGDGFGGSDDSVQSCQAPSGYVASSADCDDDESATYPGATEDCDLRDNNCNGTVDEGLLGTGTDCPAANCLDILTLDSTSSSGTYWLEAGEMECDMTTDGGGWTLLKEMAPVQSLTYVEEFYNEDEAIEWSEVWIEYDIGTLTAGCFYPTEMATCNPFVLGFESELYWGYPDVSGGEDCGEIFNSYESTTFYPSSSVYDFGIERLLTSDTIRIATMEGLTGCSVLDNGGIAHVNIWIR